MVKLTESDFVDNYEDYFKKLLDNNDDDELKFIIDNYISAL